MSIMHTLHWYCMYVLGTYTPLIYWLKELFHSSYGWKYFRLHFGSQKNFKFSDVIPFIPIRNHSAIFEQCYQNVCYFAYAGFIEYQKLILEEKSLVTIGPCFHFFAY